MAKAKAQLNNDALMAPRPPVVVVLGHVDHGKSSLLEAIREDFKIISKESGGITQHIGAYVAVIGGKPITFIDTPGHEAFSAVRSRGAKVADLAVLVVAADDGVKSQTKEAIEQAKKAELPMVVAFNKIDKPDANLERVRKQLMQEGVIVESYGGKVPEVATSATTKQGIQELLETILLMAELEEFQADVKAPAKGVVIESSLDPRRGPTATLLIKEGTLTAGSFVGTASSFGKTRIIEDFAGQKMKEVPPSFPCLVIGFENPPEVGEEFQVFLSEEEARAFVKPTIAPSFKQEIALGLPTLDIILKVDVVGSLEVVKQVLLAIPQEKVVLRFVDAEVGEITEKDVKTVIGTKARIIGFRIKTQSSAIALAQREKVKIETFNVIYELIQRVRTLMENNIEPESIKTELGSLKVLAVFLTDKSRQIIGGKVSLGEIKKGSKIEVFREDDFIGGGKIVNLQKNKKDVGSAKAGEECGLVYEGAERVEKGDVLKSFIQETLQGTL
ncbi:MAG: translation initiation factor IF-2 [bacterium]|nr:translation initiation factor IF-2 [bacterium]